MIKKCQIVVCFVLGIVSFTQASVYGSLPEYRITKDRIWTIKDSPYLIEKDLTVEKGAKLTIEPGVVIKFKTNTGGAKIKLIINGDLIAGGEENKRIVFTTDYQKPGAWGGIIFNKNGDKEASAVEYCRIEFAACGIGCFTRSPEIMNNVFYANELAIDCEDRASPRIIKNKLIENGIFTSQVGGISVALYSDPEITDNNIEKTRGANIGVSAFSNPRITNNFLAYASGRGMTVCSKASPVIVNNNLFRNGSNCGIIIYGASPVIIGNKIHEQRALGIASIFNCTPLISNNYITKNGIGLKSIYSSPIVTNNLFMENNLAEMEFWNNSDPCVNYNHIYPKEGIPSIRTGRLNNPVNLQNNYWGTTDKQAIEKSFASLVDHESPAGKLDYSNFTNSEFNLSEFVQQNTANQKASLSPSRKEVPWHIFEDKVLFCSFRDNNWEIYMTDPSGTLLKNLTKNPYHDVYPVFSPDGQKIVFSSRRSGNSDIYVIDMSNNSLTQVTNTSLNEEFPSWSPDGKKIAFRHPENLLEEYYYIIDASGKNKVCLDKTPDGYFNAVFVWVPTLEARISYNKKD